MRTIFSILLFLYIAPVARAITPYETEFCSKDLEKISEKTLGEYQIKISYANDRQCQRLEVSKKNKLLFREEGIDNHYFLGSKRSDGKHRFIMNLDGRNPHLVVSKWTGGMHCCFSLLIFELKDHFKEMAEIEGGNYTPEFSDLNHDGIPEIQLYDDFLAYRFSSFRDSARGKLVLKYNNGKYILAEELMKKPPPTKEFLKTHIPLWQKKIQEEAPNRYPEAFMQALTDLVFTGNTNMVPELINQTWPKNFSGKNEFLKSYKEALSTSKYYSKAADTLSP